MIAEAERKVASEQLKSSTCGGAAIVCDPQVGQFDHGPTKSQRPGFKEIPWFPLRKRIRFPHCIPDWSGRSRLRSMWPVGVCRSLLSASTRISTTVLATDTAIPKTRPADQPQPKAQPITRPEDGRGQALDDRPGHGDPPHGQQLLEVEVQADAEHQQDDADLGQLLGQVAVGHEARRVRPDDDARPAGSRRWAKARCAG